MRPLILLLWLASFLHGQVPAGLGLFEGASDAGNPSYKGSVAFNAATKEYRVTGGGNNIWGNRDDFYFVWRKITGPVIITANLKIVSGGAPHRKAGLMLRKDLTAGSPYADVMVHGSGLTGLQWREKHEDVTRGIQLPPEGPSLIRLERRGNWITVWAARPGHPQVHQQRAAIVSIPAPGLFEAHLRVEIPGGRACGTRTCLRPRR